MSTPSPAKLDRVSLVLSMLGAIVLCYMAGALLVYFRLPPVYNWIAEAHLAYDALKEKERYDAKEMHKPEIKEAAKPAVVKTEQAYPGYTLYTTYRSAVLIDMDGKKIYEWGRDLSSVARKSPQLAQKHLDSELLWRDAYLYPDGDMLIVSESKGGRTPYGYGLARIDKHSNPVWTYSANVHHRIAVGENGTIYAPIQKFKPYPDVPEMPNHPPKVMDEGVAMVTPEGKQLKELYLLDLLLASPYRHFLTEKSDKNRDKSWDALHINSVVPLEKSMAASFPQFKPGQLLVSVRNLSMLAVIDMETRKIVWAAQGPWRFQHDAEFHGDGSIVVFDNRGKSDAESRILKFYPLTNKSETLHEGTPDRPFFSRTRGMQHFLPNGDMLITESQKGKIFEVAPDKKIVWEYTNPLTSKKKPLPIVTGVRYDASYPTFLKKPR